MMEHENRHLRKYVRRIRRCLPCGWAEKQKIMEQITDMVGCFLEENPAADYGQIEKRFGTPQQVAITYVQEQDGDILLRRMAVRMKLVKIIGAAAVSAVLIWGLFVGTVWVKHVLFGKGYCTVQIIELPAVTEQGGT